MRVIRGRNVNGIFNEGMHLLDESGGREDSRAGPVVVAPWPVMSVYEHPTERVLFDAHRDANPFFHLMEGLWMLAGRKDSKFLNRYVKNFGERFAEPPGLHEKLGESVIHDAYGHRWRHAFGFDQLDAIVARLRANPRDRQAVLQMWDAMPEFMEHGRDGDKHGMNDLLGDWRGRPCNTHAYFRVRELIRPNDYPDLTKAFKVLDLTICCRSNDAIWGTHGANAVHFSMLLEYVAGRAGVGVGHMYQLSNNYHAYVGELERIGDPVHLEGHDPYESGEVRPLPMATDWSAWDEDLKKFMRWHDWLWSQTSEFTDFSVGVANQTTNAWFAKVPVPMTQSRWLWRMGRKDDARKKVTEISAPDWRRACVEWMERRMK